MRTTAQRQRNRCRISFPAYFAIKAVVFRSGRVGRLWRVEVGIAAEESEQERERFAQRSD